MHWIGLHWPFNPPLPAAANLSRFNVFTSVLGTGYTLGKINSDFQQGGWSNVSNWDLLDAVVGLGGLATSGAVYYGKMWVCEDLSG